MAIRSGMIPLAMLMATLGGCYSYMNENHHHNAAPSARRDQVPPARVTGPAVSCIPLTAYAETRVRDERTIDFIAPTGRKGWRNTLPYACPGLAFEQAFSFETSLSRLCSTDIIRVLQRSGPQPSLGASLWAGTIHPGGAEGALGATPRACFDKLSTSGVG